MLKTGLVSVTFRDLKVEEIINLAVKAGLDGIEWGGDIHVLHGDTKKASKVARLMGEAGLEMAAYGSYYRVGCDHREIGSFKTVLETAVVLGVPTIRVWAGERGSDDASEGWWNKVIEESYRIATMAARENIAIAYEYHDGTLTDTNESTFKLLNKVNHDNIFAYWQPPHSLSVKKRYQGLKNVLPWLKNIHVFYWTHTPEREKQPLVKAKDEWLRYLKLVSESRRDSYAMLEFVRDDSCKQFFRDAVVLKDIIREVR